MLFVLHLSEEGPLLDSACCGFHTPDVEQEVVQDALDSLDDMAALALSDTQNNASAVAAGEEAVAAGEVAVAAGEVVEAVEMQTDSTASEESMQAGAAAGVVVQDAASPSVVDMDSPFQLLDIRTVVVESCTDS